MKYVTWLIVLHMLLSYSAGLGEGFTEWLRSIADFGSALSHTHRRSKRSLIEFRDMITCLQPWVNVLETYGDYGCYCGYNGHGQPMDDTDKCCYYHDKCYGEAELKAQSFSEKAYGAYFSTYNYFCTDNSNITCDRKTNSEYQNSFCECDRIAAECFLRNRKSYHHGLVNIDTSKYCSDNPDLSDLKLKSHTLNKLYSCHLKLHDDKCCSDVGYNSEYEICCHGKVRILKDKNDNCESHSDL